MGVLSWSAMHERTDPRICQDLYSACHHAKQKDQNQRQKPIGLTSGKGDVAHTGTNKLLGIGVVTMGIFGGKQRKTDVPPNRPNEDDICHVKN